MKAINKEQNYIDAKNTLASYLNQVTPEIIEALSAGFSRKTDGSLFKKNQKIINAILDQKPEFCRVYLNVSKYSIWLHADIHYQDSEWSCEYINLDSFVWSTDKTFPVEYQPYDHQTLEQFKAAKLKIAELDKQIHELSEEQTRLNLLWNLV